MPKCKFMEDLPRLVGKAVELGKHIDQVRNKIGFPRFVGLLW
jgi:hypothetical protein